MAAEVPGRKKEKKKKKRKKEKKGKKGNIVSMDYKQFSIILSNHAHKIH